MKEGGGGGKAKNDFGKRAPRASNHAPIPRTTPHRCATIPPLSSRSFTDSRNFENKFALERVVGAVGAPPTRLRIRHVTSDTWTPLAGESWVPVRPAALRALKYVETDMVGLRV